MTMIPDMNVPNVPAGTFSERFIRDFFIFYAATLVFFGIGIITTLGLGWYRGLNIPLWTPPELVIAAVWGTLFVTTVVSLSIFCDAQKKSTETFRNTVLIYMSNALLILLWNYLFFGTHQLVLALWAAIIVAISVLILILRVKNSSKAAAWLLAPYLAWVAFAIVINYAVMLMN